MIEEPVMYPVKIAHDLAVDLRELTEDDAEGLHRVYGDEQVTEHLSFTPRTVDQCRRTATGCRG